MSKPKEKLKGKEVNRLYGAHNCPYTQRLKIIMLGKEVNSEFIYLDPQNPPDEIKSMNPYEELPVYGDSSIVLFGSEIIFDYLESRFPSPPFLPATPIGKAAVRMLVKELDDEWLPLLITALNNPTQKISALKQLVMKLFQSIKLFQNTKYLIGDRITYADVTMAVIIFNLIDLGFRIPEKLITLQAYFKRLHKCESIVTVFSKEAAEAE